MNRRLTLADLCRICAKRGIGIRIFVQDEHMGMSEPALVTIQVVSRVKGIEPRAFISHVLDHDDQLEDSLATELRKYVDFVSSGIVLTGPLKIIGRA